MQLPEIKAVLVNLVTSVIGRRPTFPIAALIDAAGRAAKMQDAVIGERPLFANGRWQTAQVLDRMRLPASARFTGPAIVQQVDATTVVEPGAVATVDAIGNLRIAVGSVA